MNVTMVTGISYHAESTKATSLMGTGRQAAYHRKREGTGGGTIMGREGAGSGKKHGRQPVFRQGSRIVHCLLTMLLLTIGSSLRAQIPILDLINAAAKKVVVAIDLQVQRLQNETIGLQNAQQDLENSMEQTKLTDITGWVQRQKDLYAGYYTELWQIKNAISAYERVTDMISKEARIAEQFKQVGAMIRQDKHFTPEEVGSMTGILTGILKEGAANISQIYLVINAFVSQMGDADRLRIIDEAGSRIDRNYTDLQQFYQRNMLLSLERARDSNDITATRMLYGIR